MTITAKELISRAMTEAGFSRPSQTQIETADNPANKAYYSLLKAISILTQMTPDWGWNAAETSTTSTISSTTITLASTVNPNIIFWLAIDSTYSLLNRVTREWLIREIFPTVSDATTNGKPQFWYVEANLLRIWPPADAAYTINYGYQKLPQSFAAENAGTTNLNIGDEVISILQGITACEILKQYGNLAKAALLENQTINMNNPYSLIRMAVRNNKLEEKKSRAKFRFPAYFRRSRHV